MMASLPLSYGQRSLWFLQQFAPAGGAYNVTIPIRLGGLIDEAQLKPCLDVIVERYPMLRARYGFDGRQPTYEIVPQVSWAIERVALPGASEEQVVAAAHEHTHRLFAIESAPILRVVLFSRSDTDHLLTITTHHLNSDLFSLASLIEDLFTMLAQGVEAAASLPPIEATFDDYVRWQADLIKSEEGTRQWQYWSSKLAGPLPKLALPTAKPRPAVQTHNGAVMTSHIARETADRLRAMAKVEGTTPFMALLTVFYMLLGEISCQDDLIVGTPIPGRRGDARFERVMGSFINVLPLRTSLGGDPTVRDLIGRVSTTVREARANQDYPFMLLVEKLRLPRDTSRTPVFQGYFTLQRLTTHQDWLGFFLPRQLGYHTQVGPWSIGTMPVSQQEGQMELAVHVYDIEGELYPEFKYNTDLFDSAMVERWMARYERLLELLIAHLDDTLAALLAR